MKRYVALLRGINVGGNNKLPMKELTAELESLGCKNVGTYIQSGNAVFTSRENDAVRLSHKITAAIKKSHGFEPRVLLLTLEELETVVAANPFPEAESDPKTLHVGFLANVPANPDLQTLEELKTKSERFHLAGRLFYLHAPDGIGRSKLAARAERLLGVSMTDRNWRTVCKLRDLAKADA